MATPTPSVTFATYVADEFQRIRALWDRFADVMLEQALQKQRTAKFPAQRDDADDLPRLLQENRNFMGVAYLDSLKTQARRSPRAASAPPSRPGPLRAPGQVLELVGLDSIALDVELARVIDTIKNEAEHELQELQQYLAALVGDADIEVDHNPFHPAAHGRALRAAAQVIRGTQAQQLAFVRAAAQPLAKLMRQAYADACARLEAAGIEPASHRCIVMPDGTRHVQGPASEAEPAPDLQRMRDAMPRPVRRAAPHEGSSGATAQAARYSVPEPERGDAPAPVRARAPVHAPAQPPARHSAHDSMRDPLPERAAAPREPAAAEVTLNAADRRAMDLVNRLFKAIPLDERVPEDVRLIIGRLHAPALRLTLRDATVLDQREHPLWKLIHLFAYQAEMLPRADDPERLNWLDFGRRTVEELAGASVQKTASYQAAFERVEQFLRERLARRCTVLAARFQALQTTEAGLAVTQAGTTTRPSSLNATLAAMLPRATLGRVSAADARVEAEAWFNGLVPGEWLRVLLQGQWVHAQLLWQGERRQIVLLGAASTDTTWALRRSVLLKMHMHGLAKTLKMRSLVGTAAMRVQEQIAIAAVA